MPAMGESVTEGTILELDKARRPVRADETLVEISNRQGRRRGALRPRPARSPRCSPPRRHRERRPGARKDDAPPQGPRRPKPRPLGPPSPPPPPCPPRRPTAPTSPPLPRRVAAARGREPPGRRRHRPGGRISKADVLAAAANGGLAAATAPAGRRGQGHADQGRRGDARPLHGREPLDPDGDLVPHPDRDRHGRPAQASSRRPGARSPHPPDRVCDRRGRDETPATVHHFSADRRQAPSRRRRPASTSARSRRQKKDGSAHPDGAGLPRRGPGRTLRAPYVKTRWSRRRARAFYRRRPTVATLTLTNRAGIGTMASVPRRWSARARSSRPGRSRTRSAGGRSARDDRRRRS